MLEKLGLPPRPSARGRSWVIDASHCQQCASQFTIFNRKHHCRRCGGLFCGNCVQARMMLRGQGDSPVRICEPCKQLELASRFDARHGRKKRDEASLEHDELLLKSLLNEEAPETPSPSSSVEPVTPESLRYKAQSEKEKSTALRKEGKTEEATKAFKKSKELEKQADALALALRKSSRKPSAATPRSSRSSEAESKTPPTAQKASTDEKKKKSTGDEDFMSELRDLGWSEAEMNPKPASDAEILREGGSGQKSGKVEALRMEILGHKRRALALKREGKLAEAKEELKLAKTLEKRVEEIETLGQSEEEVEEEDGDELSAVLRALEKEIDQPGKKQPVELDAGSLPVIREDFGDDDQVDVSEKDFFDPEMLAALKAIGWAEEPRVAESLSSRPRREELQAEILSRKRKALAFKRAGNLAEARRELAEAKAMEKTLEESEVGETEEVSEHDMRDPGMLAALRALGFGDDDRELVAPVDSQEKRLLQREAGAVKLAAEAALNRGENMSLQEQQVKLKFDSRVRTRASAISDDDEEDPMSFVKDLSGDPEVAAMLKGLGEEDGEAPLPAAAAAQSSGESTKMRRKVSGRTPPVELPTRSKREIQQALLGKKRLALSLRRQGKDEEAERVLKEASALEMQLKALEEAENKHQVQSVQLDGEEDEDEEENDEVSENDLIDPTLLAALSALGFREGAAAPVKQDGIVPVAVTPELKADGDDDDAGFEGEYGEIGQVVDVIPPFFSRFTGSSSADKNPVQAPASELHPSSKQQATLNPAQAQAPSKQPRVEIPERVSQAKGVQAPELLPPKRQEKQQGDDKPSTISSVSSSSSRSVEQQILEHKRNALRMKKAGDLAGAREELRQAKLLEKSEQQESNTATTSSPPLSRTSTTTLTSTEPRLPAKEEQKKAESSFKDRMKLQRESLAHKRRALALRKEGKTEEAEAEFELAKALERQMEELQGSQALGAAPDEGVEDVMDSQLAAALAGLGFQLHHSSSSSSPQPKVTEAQPRIPRVQAPAQRQQLESSSAQEKIRSLRLRALELKRAGKQQEALQALREAKMLEKDRGS